MPGEQLTAATPNLDDPFRSNGKYTRNRIRNERLGSTKGIFESKIHVAFTI
jgi:hypothetical protein